MYHFPNHIDVVLPYTHTHTVLVHDNQYANYCIIQIPKVIRLIFDYTTNIRLISVHVLRTELQVSISVAVTKYFFTKYFTLNTFFCQKVLVLNTL